MPTTTPESQPTARDAAELARDRATRTAGRLSELLAERPELHGVHAPADWAYDAVRWSA